ncbi:MAG: hypothetical protein H6595_10125 [Flavobacteriales bacterium]|nr:hypothetical protein [Flavobacteriales bacterium]MCB9167818.1 hypothetical protein [Flavobacteriales bacterium]
MDRTDQIVIVVVVATILLVVLVGFVGLLLVVNANRRHRHRAELAEQQMLRDGQVREAEREATRHTLTDVGRELHDNAGQLLQVAQMGILDRLEQEAEHDPAVATALQTLEQGIHEVRRLGRSLNRDLWQQRGLLDALKDEAVRVQRITGIKVHVEVEGHPREPGADAKTILFRTFQEVLSNALRHSRASEMHIRIGDVGGFTMHFADNGRGFDAHTPANGSGLLNIRQRCALIGFDARLVTAPDQGTTWTFTPTAGNAP